MLNMTADGCRAMLCISASYAIMQCLSICPHSWILSKRINISSKFFSIR